MNTSRSFSEQEAASAVEAAALDWFFRRRDGSLDAAGEAEFQAWLRAAPEHAREYEQFTLAWGELDALPEAARSAAVKPRPAAARGIAWLPRAALASCALLLLCWTVYRYLPVEHHILQADAGAQSLTLSDGTRIDAGPRTRLSVRYTLARRDVVLEHGEAFFDIGADRRRFTLHSTASRVRDIGTEFNVVALEDYLRVSVKSGAVLLTPDARQAHMEWQLAPGDSATIMRDGRQVGRTEIAHNTPAEVGAWQQDLLILQADTLAYAAAYLSHYRGAPVRVVHPGAAALRLSGTVDLRQPDAFLAALPTLLPQTVVTPQPDGSVFIALRH
ncbi:DUF4880 domain-containing protein [Pseudothauera nasutitermitis]|uniref:DUF4880 domain-containing protein n=1 Tax=Pseudothauera nasutitermitis TaxID=2565930 RepID=A0A4S4B521_9RHOO|nr:FecR domain-containing protein [Pseudothauera nasutitermitis]THF66067.1 DUF4880 domain-containing protein [Pseudothauera nasutitermitis]